MPLYAVYSVLGAWLCLLIAKHSKPKPPVWRGNSYATVNNAEKKGLSINVTDRKLWQCRLLCWVELIAYPVVVRCIAGEISFYGIWPYLVLCICFLKDRESPYKPQVWNNLYRAAWIVYAIIAVIQHYFHHSEEGENIASSHLLITLPIYMLYTWIIMTQMQIYFMKKQSKPWTTQTLRSYNIRTPFLSYKILLQASEKYTISAFENRTYENSDHAHPAQWPNQYVPHP